MSAHPGMVQMFAPLESRIEEEMNLGTVSDVCFGAGPAEEVCLFGSKTSLALASPVFNAMFFAEHWLQDGACNAAGIEPQAADRAPAAIDSSRFRAQQHTYVAVTDVEPSALRCMLRYVHHLEPRLTLDNALHVYRAADKYQMDGLLGACAAFLDEQTNRWDVDQSLRLFDIACRLGLDKYSQRFLEELGELSRIETSRLLAAEEFGALHSVSITALLDYSGLATDEASLWRALRCWAEQKSHCCDQLPELSPEIEDIKRERPSSPTWQDALRPLKRLIRFPTMQASFFAEEVAQSGLLEPKEVVDIFCHLARRSAACTVSEDKGTNEALVAGIFRTDLRAPPLEWSTTRGQSDAASDEESCLGGLGAMWPSETFHLDSRSLSQGQKGPLIVLGGPGHGYRFAFGSIGFSSGRHAWTISWRPTEAMQPNSKARGCRGGAAGVAREGDVFGERGGIPTMTAGGVPGTGCTPMGSMTAATAKSMGPSSISRTAGASSTAGSSSGTNGNSCVNSGVAEEPSAFFVDWPTCIVFGVKRSVGDCRYVAWDTVDGDAITSNRVVRFAIKLDFYSRTVTYMADRGERQWSASLVHDGPVYPVIAASGAQYFHIQYGVHL